jgi:hypothetical protein
VSGFVAAVEAGQFLALTTPTVHDELCERVADIDAYSTRYQKRSP